MRAVRDKNIYRKERCWAEQQTMYERDWIWCAAIAAASISFIAHSVKINRYCVMCVCVFRFIYLLNFR